MHTFHTVIQHPANDTFCEGSNVVLRCVIFNNSTNDAADGASWFDANSLVLVPHTMISNSRLDDVVTSILTIENVSLNDDGTGYLCSPALRIESYVGVISVAGIHKHYLPMYVSKYTLSRAGSCYSGPGKISDQHGRL